MGAHRGHWPAPDPHPTPRPFLQHCEFRMRGHYHCLRTGCYFVTNITTKLPWHIKKHEKAERRAANGFKYFTKREECGRLGTGSQDWGGSLRQVAGCSSGPFSRYLPLLPASQALRFVNIPDLTGWALSHGENHPNSPGIRARVTWSAPATPHIPPGKTPHGQSQALNLLLFPFPLRLCG